MANIVESVTLNFTDLTGSKTGCTKLGSNKFWKGWVEDCGGSANFECRWGPTGEAGSDKGSKRGVGLAEARKLLASKVNSKEKKGYTRLLVRDDDEEKAKAAAKGIDLTTGKKAAPVVAPTTTPKFHPEVGRLLGIIYGENAKVVTKGLSAQAGATADNPIGNLSDRQLDIGGSVLDEIEAELRSTFGHESSSNKGQNLPLVGGRPNNRIISLTNDYMSNVPREIGRAMRGPSNLHKLVISSYERLEGQRKFLQLLRDAHLTQAVFKAAAHQSSTAGKEGVWYDGLGCDIDICEPGSADFKRVVGIFEKGQSRKNSNWFRGSQSVLRVARVFKLTRTGTEGAFNAYAAKMAAKPGAIGKVMAWHGTRTENLLGISKSGLLMPENLPKGVHISGKAFGKGIYHAPVTTSLPEVHGAKTDGTNGALKSMNYTSARGAYYGANNRATGAFMYLQEVAMGCGQVTTSACWDQKRPNGWPKNDFIYAAAGGCSTLSHDELVTFDQDAQMFRYLLEIETV